MFARRFAALKLAAAKPSAATHSAYAPYNFVGDGGLVSPAGPPEPIELPEPVELAEPIERDTTLTEREVSEILAVYELETVEDLLAVYGFRTIDEFIKAHGIDVFREIVSAPTADFAPSLSFIYKRALEFFIFIFLVSTDTVDKTTVGLFEQAFALAVKEVKEGKKKKKNFKALRGRLTTDDGITISSLFSCFPKKEKKPVTAEEIAQLEVLFFTVGIFRIRGEGEVYKVGNPFSSTLTVSDFLIANPRGKDELFYNKAIKTMSNARFKRDFICKF